jgi:hypothetical protein
MTNEAQEHLQTLIIFLHLPKTAGSTLARIIQGQYAASGIISLYDSMLGEELASLPWTKLENLRVVMGHLYFGVHNFLPGPSTYITMLRDPVDRVISHYYFVRQDPSHYLYDSAHKMSMQEYIVSCNRQEPNNDQTRLLAGKRETSSFGTCTDEMLDIAKKNLTEHFTVVGITEEFDRSLILMKRNLGWRSPFYINQNVSRHRPRKEDISLETLRVVQAYNELDIELYRFANELFQEQIHSQGPSFTKELDRFKKLNRFYARFLPLVSVVRSGTAVKKLFIGPKVLKHA